MPSLKEKSPDATSRLQKLSCTGFGRLPPGPSAVSAQPELVLFIIQQDVFITQQDVLYVRRAAASRIREGADQADLVRSRRTIGGRSDAIPRRVHLRPLRSRTKMPVMVGVTSGAFSHSTSGNSNLAGHPVDTTQVASERRRQRAEVERGGAMSMRPGGSTETGRNASFPIPRPRLFLATPAEGDAG